ncbi:MULTISPECIES: hypothetical protein [unclassified Candidatus Pelagibacter]|uniref:hypothetical protein n=1 Tax=unclassified Candidatus Pelagibacter TaxID=2647897 RepID=UPI003F84DD7A
MWIEKFNKPYKEKIKKLNFNFADIKKGETMLVSSPSSIANFIKKIPKGKKKTVVEMRNALAKKAKANKTCPVSTGIFLRIAIEASLEEQSKRKLKKPNLPFWRIIDEKTAVAKKLSISKKLLNTYINQELRNE